MNENELLIEKFYTAFQVKDYATMQSCYSNHATFSDEVFVGLNAEQVRAMWEMLLKNGKDLKLEFKNIKADGTTGSAEWIAYYTFSKTGNKVINRITASFIFENGKIIQHTDQFNFYKWASQALGNTGLLLGWTSFLKNKVRSTAMKSLVDFMKSKKK
jgi:ketosteroid isomerase-like protein